MQSRVAVLADQGLHPSGLNGTQALFGAHVSRAGGVGCGKQTEDAQRQLDRKCEIPLRNSKRNAGSANGEGAAAALGRSRLQVSHFIVCGDFSQFGGRCESP
jgi:hypothetical protein